jgi:hypothetical protein
MAEFDVGVGLDVAIAAVLAGLLVCVALLTLSARWQDRRGP